MAFSGYQDFNPNFSDALQQMIAARPGISVGSGYRSPERQAELFRAAVAKYGSEEKARHWVAPPGKSRHNMGIAADLAFATPEDRAWAHANAANFGLNFRMGHEPWHIELIDGKPVPVQDTPPAGSSVVDSGATINTGIDRNSGDKFWDAKSQLLRSPQNPNYFEGQVVAQDIDALSKMLRPTTPPKSAELLKKIRDYG